MKRPDLAAMRGVRVRLRTLLIAAMFAAMVGVDANAQGFTCPQRPSSAAGRSFENQTLTFVNFARLDLTNANFRGATLKGVSFIRANLTGADFSGATFVDTGNPGRTSDFSFARLDSACFIGAKFQAPTYFTYATLTSVDFSQTDLSNGNAIFGDQKLMFDASATVRPNFRATVLNCEFVGQWNQLDLTGANIGACRDQLQPGHDFSNARMAGVVFDELNLSKSKWAGADLTGAVFTNASIYGSGLSTPPPTCSTDLSSNGCTVTGATCSCATLSGANLTGTNFANAYLFGVDFTTKTVINGTDFSGAILISANFSDANWNVIPTQGGAPPLLSGAYLQGVDMHDANLTDAVLAGAYLDFGVAGSSNQGGNQVFLKLSGGYTSFNGWGEGPGVCIAVAYGSENRWSRLPTTNRMTCPDGQRRTGGCGDLDPSNSNWKSGSTLASAAVPGFYLRDASFEKANPDNPVCNLQSINFDW